MYSRIGGNQPHRPASARRAGTGHPGRYADWRAHADRHQSRPDRHPQVEEGKDLPRYGRELTLEVWYSAEAGTGSGNGYSDVLLRDGVTKVELTGAAERNADPAKAGGPYPLVMISHCYPGNRFLMSHLGENLATKGYVMVSIDHTESTYDNKAAFGSTLVNRPLDQRYVLDAIERMSKSEDSFLSGLVNTDDTGLVGYSMGGYGGDTTAGGGCHPGKHRIQLGRAGGHAADASGGFGNP